MGIFRAELRMLEDRKAATHKHHSIDMGDIGCLKGRVHRGAVLVSIDGECMLDLDHEDILREVQYARTDNQPHQIRFTHAPIHWLIPVKSPELAVSSPPQDSPPPLFETPPLSSSSSQPIKKTLLEKDTHPSSPTLPDQIDLPSSSITHPSSPPSSSSSSSSSS
eukprot:CAMPEP_0114390192 /NCGR_PEP_ID=MMETSP0102-20121206/9191_1 /TAXON_ID=38822 ORGANISM="Pteridomonas danica, Strain PT" /NCGR_SAMPLE_ID=MMETSP0102 /ASSEMBLY_ACC=CAM_ASM_000212 /LENGTH=163 /DNA_ID=CAMNT_0001548403 /DNA_START=132 /DNA_END=620 /DNA_ORIENTATION=+